jgi:hypothetical protein
MEEQVRKTSSHSLQSSGERRSEGSFQKCKTAELCKVSRELDELSVVEHSKVWSAEW